MTLKYGGQGCFLVSRTGRSPKDVLQRFSYDLEMKTREQRRKNKRTEIERFDWFIERIQTRVVFGWLSERSGKKLHAQELSRNKPILRLDVILQHDWPIEQCLLHIRVFFGWKNEESMFSSVHPLADKTNNEKKNPRRTVIRSTEYYYCLCLGFVRVR